MRIKHTTQPNGTKPGNARLFKLSKINQYNPSHLQTKKGKLHGPIKRHRQNMWQNSTPFMIQTTLKKPLREADFHEPIKSLYKKLMVNLILHGERLNAFPPRSGTRIFILTTPNQHNTASTSLVQ